MSPTAFSKDFPIDAGVFTDAKVSLVDASTDADVRDAILAVTSDQFPARDVQLGHIAFAAETGQVTIKPAAAPGASVSFAASASAQATAGVYSKVADAIAALGLTDPPDLAIQDAAGKRFVLFACGYSASGSVEGSHPLGALGSVSFGADANRRSLFAILHRFADGDRAHVVLDDVFASWRLPRHVAFAAGGVNIKPGTWLIAEADGSLAFTIASSLGWNVAFAKDATLLGVTHNLSAKIDASLKATFGFNVSGKYLVVVARETDTPVVRVQLWKQSSKGFNFGFNLNVGLQGADPQLPASFDDLIKSTFGVHGLQVVKDIRDWTSAGTDLGQKIAGLANQTALDLLTKTTGIDAAKEFERARQALKDALATWDSLPQELPPMLWKLLPAAASADAAALQAFLVKLKDPQAGAQALAGALQKATFGDTPEGRFLEAIAEKGLLALADQLSEVRLIADKVLSILDGRVIGALQELIDQKLNLDQIRKAVNATDFAKIDEWLQKRLANFLDHELRLEDLQDIQKAIATLDSKAASYYSAGVKALTKKYTLQFAATYQSTTSDSALIDAEFDLSTAAGAMFAEVVGQARFDRLLTTATAGVTVHQATLTHEIKRSSTVDLHLPLFDFKGTHVNDAMATLTAEDQTGRVLLYQVTGKDTVTVASRTSSQLALFASLEVVPGEPPRLGDSGSVSYEMRQVKADMRPSDLEARTTGFVHTYLRDLFAGDESSIRGFYTDLDDALTAATQNPKNHLGDIALSLQASVGGAALASWFQARKPNQLKADQMRLSRAVQQALQDLLPQLYFQDVRQYGRTDNVVALLVWSCLRVSTSIDFDPSDVILRFDTDDDVFWDWPSRKRRAAVAADVQTVGRLAGRLAAIQAQLRGAGQSNADDFDPAKADQFIAQALSGRGDDFFQSLLSAEADLLEGAAKALKDVSNSLATMPSAPTAAIRTLTKFASSLTSTFNGVQTVYSGVSGRAIGPILLVHASAALGAAAVTPKAMLTLAALKPGHAFELGTFIDGKTPPQSEIALTQTLVSLE